MIHARKQKSENCLLERCPPTVVVRAAQMEDWTPLWEGQTVLIRIYPCFAAVYFQKVSQDHNIFSFKAIDLC